MMRPLTFIALALLCSSGLAQPSSFDSDGLVGWWDFDGDFCSIDGAHCFEEFGSLELQASNDSAGNVVEFNGGYLELGADEAFDLEEFTIVLRGYADDRIEVWKGSPGYPDDVNYRVVMGSSAVHPIGYSSGCGLTLDGANTTVWSVPAMQVDQVWQTVVVSRNIQGEVTVYTSEGVTTWETEGGICTESNPLRLGRWWDGDIKPSQGLIDFLGIWSRSFDFEEAIQVVNIQGGCTDPMACNYEEEALFHDGNCQYFSECCPVGQLWDPATLTCRLLLDSTSVCGPGTTWDVQTSTCIATGNPSDTDFDGCVGMADLLDLLSAFGTCVEQDPAEGVVDWSCGDPLEYQGYDYETVQIGDQCWFAENLRAERYSNNEELVDGQNPVTWTEIEEGAYSVFSLEQYGLLYNRHAVMDSRNVCPVGWRVSSVEDWGNLYAMSIPLGVPWGEALKSDFGWTGGWANGQDTFGFSAVPGGVRAGNTGEFFGSVGTFHCWTTSSSGEEGIYMWIYDNSDWVFEHTGEGWNEGRSVRCMQDIE